MEHRDNVPPMERDVNAQLRITAWPGMPLPLPDTYRVESSLDLDEGVIVPRPRGLYGRDWEEEPVALNGETYLRLAAVDLDDPHAIFDFVARYGPLGGWDAYVTFLREAPFAIAKLYQAQLDLTVEGAKKQGALQKEQARAGSETVWPSDALRSHYTESLEEFRFAARLLRDLTSAWRMFKDGTSARDVEWVSPLRSDPEFLQEDGFPVYLLSEGLPRWFLQPFSPRLMFRWTPALPAGPAFSNLPPRHGGINVDPTRRPVAGGLYAICALELFNHIVDNADYLICGNENCQQKHFVHQQGRSEKGQHRSYGVKFCSPACARATAQRRYRQRRKQKRTSS